MKKIISLIMVAMMAIALTACGNTDNSDSKADTTKNTADNNSDNNPTDNNSDNNLTEVTVTCLNGNSEEVEITVPYSPERIVVLDFATLDVLDNLGLGDKVVGVPNITLDYLSDYGNTDTYTNVGSIKTADMEAIVALEPDIIFMGGRMSDSYDELMDIAPVVRLTTDSSIGLLESIRKNGKTIASIFGLDAQVDEKLTDFDNRIAALAAVAEGKTAIITMCSGGSASLLGNDGRCSIIGTEIGFENVGVSNDVATATHGNEASFEFYVSANPDYIFVMDRDGAISGTVGTQQLAKDIMENELVMQTDAYKNGKLIYLEHPGVWYTGEGGITAFDYMLKDLEAALLK